MKLTREQTQVLAAAAGLDIPEEDLESVTLRVSARHTARPEYCTAPGQAEPIPLTSGFARKPWACRSERFASWLLPTGDAIKIEPKE